MGEASRIRNAAASPSHAAQPSAEVVEGSVDLAPVVRFIGNALSMKTARGDAAHYNKLVHELTAAEDPQTLWRLYAALAECATVISENPHAYKDLIHAVFQFDWSRSSRILQGGRLQQAYATLVARLVSVNSIFLLPAMHMLVRNLAVKPLELTGSEAENSAAVSRQGRLHAMLRALLALTPSGCGKLLPVVAEHFPHRRAATEVLADFAAQALTVTRYVPPLQERVLSLVIQRCLELDVEIKITEQGHAVHDKDELIDNDAIFSLEDEAAPPQCSMALNGTLEAVDETAEKLDSVMLVLFTYILQEVRGEPHLEAVLAPPETLPAEGRRTLADGGMPAAAVDSAGAAVTAAAAAAALAEEEAAVAAAAAASGGARGSSQALGRLFRALLAVFETSILLTHRSKFVQYVMFFLCGQVPQLSRLFVARLLDIAFDRNAAGITRQSALAYLASFLARGSFIPREVVFSAVGALLQAAASYVDDQEAAAAAAAAAAAFPAWRSAYGSLAAGFAVTPGGAGVAPAAAAAGGAASPAVAAAAAAAAGMPTTPRSGHRRAIAGSTLATPWSASAGRGRGSSEPNGSCVAAKDRHLLFYSTCQAAFYVVCFRAAGVPELCASPLAAVWERILASPMQPLRFCLDSVRREFARLCCVLMSEELPMDLLARLQLVAAEAQAVESEAAPARAAIVPGSSLGPAAVAAVSALTKVGGLGRGSNPLDSFFPFDPYLLRRSHAYVEGFYNHWKGPGWEDKSDNGYLTDDSSEEEDGVNADEEEREGEEGRSGRGAVDSMVGSVSDKLALSYISETMSVTPGYSPLGRGAGGGGGGRGAAAAFGGRGGGRGSSGGGGTGSLFAGDVGGTAMSVGGTSSWGGSVDQDHDIFHEDVSPPLSPLPPGHARAVVAADAASATASRAVGGDDAAVNLRRDRHHQDSVEGDEVW